MTRQLHLVAAALAGPALALSACSPPDPAPTPPAAVAQSAPAAAVAPPNPAVVAAAPETGPIYKTGTYYINLPDNSESCEARHARSSHPAPGEQCVSREAYRKACASIRELSQEALDSLARRNSGTLGRLASKRALDAVEFGWGWPGGAQEDACFAEVKLPRQQLLPGESDGFRFRISAFQVGSAEGVFAAVDLD